MKLEDISSKELLALHNRFADKPAGPKTFATRGKLIARLRSIAEAKNLDLRSLGQPEKPEATAAAATPSTKAAEGPDTARKKRGLGVGELARTLLMHPAGYPHAHIAEMVNAQIQGAHATAKSVRMVRVRDAQTGRHLAGADQSVRCRFEQPAARRVARRCHGGRARPRVTVRSTEAGGAPKTPPPLWLRQSAQALPP